MEQQHVIIAISLAVFVYIFMWMQQMLKHQRHQRHQRQLLSAMARMNEQILKNQGTPLSTDELMVIHESKV